MLVKHLIRELQKCNPEARVITEGCDCTGDTYSLAPESKGRWVEISRSERYTKKYDNGSDTPDPLEKKVSQNETDVAIEAYREALEKRNSLYAERQAAQMVVGDISSKFWEAEDLLSKAHLNMMTAIAGTVSVQ